MKKVLLFFLLLAVYLPIASFSQNTSEVVSSNDPNVNSDGISWSVSTTWSPSGVPNGLSGKTQTITIEVGDRVNITSASTEVTAGPVNIIVKGILHFDQTGQLQLPSGSTIWVEKGGDIQVENPENNSTKLIIGSSSNKLAGGDLHNVEGPTFIDESNLSKGGCFNCTPTPVELLYFKAQAQKQSVEVNWASSKAWDFSHYELERSSDGRIFEYIATIDAEEFSNGLVEFSYSDRQPISGTSYYRLRAVDIDGAFEYKEVAVVKFGTESFKVYPNPSNLGYIHVSWSHASKEAS